jgi:leucyl aminopeptidase
VPVSSRGDALTRLGRFARFDPHSLLALAEASGRGYAVAPVGAGSELDAGYAGLLQIPEGVEAPAQIRLRALGAAHALPGDVRTIAVDVGALADPLMFRAACEGAILGRGRARGSAADRRLEELEGVGEPSLRPVLEAGAVTGAAVNWVRSLVDTPSDVLTPAAFTGRALDMAQAVGIQARAWSVEDIIAERFAGLLTVARGAASTPTVVELEYTGASAAPCVVLVGKAITFDSGGLQAKTTRMEWNKADMAGAAAILGALWAATEIGLRLNVRALIPCTENFGGPDACRPGDVIHHRNERSVEIRNTDAEGRLILADLLAYAAESRPRALIDVGTLTNPYGERVWGFASNDEGLAAEIAAASVDAGEPSWRIPLHHGYLDQLTSPVADLANYPPVPSAANDNSAVRAITAALFLETFGAGVPWAHLDIAGTAFHLAPTAGWPAGATGSPTATLIRLMERFARST